MANINDPNPFNNFSEGYEDFGSGGKRHLERKAKSFVKHNPEYLSPREIEDRANQLNLMNRRAFTTHARQPKLRQTAMEILDPRKDWSNYNRNYATNGLLNARKEKRKAKWSDILPPRWNTNDLPPGRGPKSPYAYLSLKDEIEKEKKEESKIGDNYLLYRPRKHSYNWR